MRGFAESSHVFSHLSYFVEDSASDDTDSSMTVFCGLNLVMPMISEQMLQVGTVY
jgi:hypothetical protein